MKLLVAITGGIGSGKSVVCRILRTLGYPVYDCDSRAKALMDADDTIKRRLTEEIDSLCVVDGAIDRRRLAAVVFEDAEKLAMLNSMVHSAVRDDIAAWVGEQERNITFVETAILYESGLNTMVDAEWRVESPLELRIARTMKRSAMSRSEVEKRIAAQNIDAPTGVSPVRRFDIYNDETQALLPQIEALITTL